MKGGVEWVLGQGSAKDRDLFSDDDTFVVAKPEVVRVGAIEEIQDGEISADASVEEVFIAEGGAAVGNGSVDGIAVSGHGAGSVSRRIESGINSI